jgi:hypothetical protein
MSVLVAKAAVLANTGVPDELGNPRFCVGCRGGRIAFYTGRLRGSSSTSSCGRRSTRLVERSRNDSVARLARRGDSGCPGRSSGGSDLPGRKCHSGDCNLLTAARTSSGPWRWRTAARHRAGGVPRTGGAGRIRTWKWPRGPDSGQPCLIRDCTQGTGRPLGRPFSMY